jgi:asparagine synthase (glutamine-hydrolysing)
LLLVPRGATAWVECPEDAIVAGDLDISNTAELLGSTGTTSAGEALRHLHRADETRFPNRLRGAFVVAIWIPSERRLTLAADRFGFRRMYYAATETGISFGAQLQAVAALSDGPHELDFDAVYAYMNFATVPAPQSMYRGVRRLPPGHTLVWHDGQVSTTPYWEIEYTEQHRRRSAAARMLVQRTEDAVRQALVGAEPKHTGAFLSGGTDSSTVVGFMSRLTGERPSAFSIGFQEQRYDELPYAVLAARHFGASHYTQVVTADDAFACVPDLVAGYDEPFGNNSAIPTYLCARFAADTGMQLLLAGDGGDEIFGGNERYRRERVLARYGLMPRWLRRHALEPLLRTLPPGGQTLLGKAQRYVQLASQPNPDRFYSSEFFIAHWRTCLLDPAFLDAVSGDWPLQVARRHYGGARTSAELNRLLYVDLKITLGDNDLLKVTRAAELAGIGVRFPMLDHPLVEFTATLPARDKVRGSQKRYLFKHSFRGFLPPEVLGKRKHGFGLPISQWLKSHAGFRGLARDTLLSARCLQRGYFLPGALEALFRQHERDTTPYYGDLLWTLLMLELWHQRQEGSA